MNLNKVFLLGNLTRDPEIRTTSSGQQVANFGIATNRIWIDSQGQKQQRTEFHNIIAWGRLAEICKQYLTKGRLTFIEGRITTRNWEDQNGVKHYRTEIIAENMQMGPKIQKNEENLTQSENKEKSEIEPVVNEESSENKENEDINLDDLPF